eukprot:7155838-Lingulodinium_polyedra.AAC.1
MLCNEPLAIFEQPHPHLVIARRTRSPDLRVAGAGGLGAWLHQVQEGPGVGVQAAQDVGQHAALAFVQVLAGPKQDPAGETIDVAGPREDDA